MATPTVTMPLFTRVYGTDVEIGTITFAPDAEPTITTNDVSVQHAATMALVTAGIRSE